MNVKLETNGIISIIMAAYNAERTISMAIESVLAQTYTNWELIVIDDGSEDATSSIVRGYEEPRIHLIQNDRNKGVSASRKEGMEEARGEWIAILDSDDKWLPDKLQKQLEAAASNEADIVFTGSAFMDYEGHLKNWQLHVPRSISYRELLKQNLISNSSVLVKADLYRKYYVSGDDLHEDYALWLSILGDGGRAYGIDEPLLVYRLAKTSKSGNKRNAARMNWNTYRYIGLNLLETLYYMCWYMTKGIMKYRHLR